VVKEETASKEIKDSLENKEVHISFATGKADALTQLKDNKFQCLVLDPDLPDNGVYEILKKIDGTGNSEMPVVLYGNDKLSKAREKELHSLFQNILIKPVTSSGQL